VEKGTGLGFSVLLGLEISLGQKPRLFLDGNSIFGNITIEDQTVNVGNDYSQVVYYLTYWLIKNKIF